MHHLGRPHDSRAKRLGDRLMPETDAQQRRFSGIVADNREGNPRLIRRAGPGEITIFSGASAAISSSVNASLCLTSTSAPSSQKY